MIFPDISLHFVEWLQGTEMSGSRLFCLGWFLGFFCLGESLDSATGSIWINCRYSKKEIVGRSCRQDDIFVTPWLKFEGAAGKCLQSRRSQMKNRVRDKGWGHELGSQPGWRPEAESLVRGRIVLPPE